MENSIGSYKLKASPEGIQSVAKSVFEKIRLLENNVTTIRDRLEATSNYWEGDAADTYRKDLKADLENAQKWITYFRNYITELDAIAATYTGVENNLVEEFSTQLSAEVIV